MHEFWALLYGGVEGVSEIPEERLDGWTGAAGRSALRRGGRVEGLELFDPHPFGLAPREAASLDPQQRLMLEATWEALEMAGLPLERVAGRRAGVYVGLWTSDYESCMYGAQGRASLSMVSGAGRHTAAGRISHVFNLHGPSMVVDTACSSSLVAVHLARQSLLAGESELAVAGAANVILQPPVTEAFAGAGMLAADGRCKFGDACADGYVRSEGAGVVVLKRLSDARRDGDPIQAVILGSAIEHDGREGLFLSPCQSGQERLLRAACAAAGVAPEDVQYVEAHGTGTAAGDPVELKALGAVLGAQGERKTPLLVGSVKTNIGHTEAAAGMAGLIKTVLALQHRQIPASLNLEEPNPNISWAELPLEIPTEARAWPEGGGAPLLAGVNSFGVAGTNAHVVVTAGEMQAVAAENEEAEDRAWLLPISAHSPEALRELAGSWRKLLMKDFKGEPPAALRDLCYTAAVRRTHHEHRLALAGRRRAELAERLEAWLDGAAKAATPYNQGAGKGGLTFVFSGQGGQWHAMGRELMEHEPVYRACIERCDALLRQYVDWSLLDELEADKATSRIDRTDRTQPALFAMQLGLAELLRSWGITPDACVGHSFGEVTAACVAGALSVEDGIRIIAHRGRLQQRLAGRGRMAATDLTLEEAGCLLEPYTERIVVAAINSGRSLTLAGEPDAVAEIAAELERQGRFVRIMRSDIAFHSPQMEPCMAELTDAVRGIAVRMPRQLLVSTVTGRETAGEDFGPEYWARNLRQPVRFAEAIETLIERGMTTFVELGPHPVLSVSISQCLKERGVHGTALPTMRRGEDEPVTIRQALGALYAQGRAVDWQALHPERGRVVALPPYPWQRERFWYEEDVQTLLHAIEWTPAPQGELPAPKTAQGCWLVFADRGGVGEQLARHIEAAGGQCVIVGPGTGNNQLDPQKPEQFTELVRALQAQYEEPIKGAFYLWSLDEPALEELEAQPTEALAQSIVRTDAGALHLAQALARLEADARVRLWLVTRGAQPAGWGAPAGAAQATLWGMGRVVQLEHPELRCSLVDLDPQAGAEESADQLLVEALHDDGEFLVAWRGAERLGARLEAAPLAPGRRGGMQMRGGASYLITGGLGGLGLVTARWLASRGARRLALAGRRAPDEEALAVIRELETRGVRVLILAADVSRAEEVERLVGRVEAELGPLAGVVHAAGVLADATLLKQEWKRFEQALAAKALGAWNLHRATRRRALDFFVCYSSTAAVLGSSGQANYAAANAFLDALAHWRKARSLPALSINWGPWAAVGMAAGGKGVIERLAGQGLKGLSPEEGVAALERLLASDLAQAIVMRLEAGRWRASHQLMAQSPYLEWLRVEPETRANLSAEAPQPVEGDVRQVLRDAAPGPAGRQIMEDHLRRQVARVLLLSESRVSAHRPFKSMGLDSLTGLELRNRLEASLGLTLPAALVWTYPTIDALGPHLTSLVLEGDEPERGTPQNDALVSAVALLSDAEAEAQLLAELSILESRRKQ